MKMYRCRNGCHISDKYGRCPHCDQWLLYDGEHEVEEYKEKIAREQRERAKAYTNCYGEIADFKPRVNSRTRAYKEKAKREEIKFLNK